MQSPFELVPSDTTFNLRTGLNATDASSPVGEIQQEPSITANFHQRRSDVFASLAGLEVAHEMVTKHSKPERDALRKSVWRRTETAPENLEEQKKNRDRGINAAFAGQQSSEFRRPRMPPARQHPRRRACDELSGAPRDPTKWTHYSLLDVDEDNSGQSDFAIASSFLCERRICDDGQPSDDETLACGQPRRLLFRPTRGVKRSRHEVADDVDAVTTHQKPLCLPTESELHEEEIQSHNSFSSSDTLITEQPSTGTTDEGYVSPHFRSRRQRGQMRVRQPLPETGDDLQQVSHLGASESSTDKPPSDDELEEVGDEDGDDVDQSSNFLA